MQLHLNQKPGALRVVAKIVTGAHRLARPVGCILALLAAQACLHQVTKLEGRPATNRGQMIARIEGIAVGAVAGQVAIEIIGQGLAVEALHRSVRVEAVSAHGRLE